MFFLQVFGLVFGYFWLGFLQVFGLVLKLFLMLLFAGFQFTEYDGGERERVLTMVFLIFFSGFVLHFLGFWV